MKAYCEHVDRYSDGHCKVCTRARRRKTKGGREYNKQWAKTLRGRALRMLTAARSRSRERGMPAPTIDNEWVFQRLSRGVCEMSGVRLSMAGLGGPYAPSLDRRDSQQPYTPENTRITCWALNSAFCDWGAEAFAPIAEAWLRQRALLGDLA